MLPAGASTATRRARPRASVAICRPLRLIVPFDAGASTMKVPFESRASPAAVCADKRKLAASAGTLDRLLISTTTGVTRAMSGSVCCRSAITTSPSVSAMRPMRKRGSGSSFFAGSAFSRRRSIKAEKLCRPARSRAKLRTGASRVTWAKVQARSMRLRISKSACARLKPTIGRPSGSDSRRSSMSSRSLNGSKRTSTTLMRRPRPSATCFSSCSLTSAGTPR